MFRQIMILSIFMTIAACVGSPLQTVNKHDISFDVSAQLELEEYSLDLARQLFRKGPSKFDQGVIMSSEKNFILEWVYEPVFTPQLAKAQVRNGPAFFESTNPDFRVSLTSLPQTKRISNLNVTFAEMEVVFSQGSSAPAVIGVWQCQPSERAIIFIALNNQPIKELERFVSSFSCI